MKHVLKISIFVILGLCTRLAKSDPLKYECTDPLLQVRFHISGEHYNGSVNCGNLFLQTDIQKAPTVYWPQAVSGKYYTLLLLDLDGNANGSWPDPVPHGENAPIRHWIVGNISGEQLHKNGYTDTSRLDAVMLQAYRGPHIPIVSDRYGLYLFEQNERIVFQPLAGAVTQFDYQHFLNTYHLKKLVAANYFIALYTSVSPFSGKPFHGNAVQGVWHKDYGHGKLTVIKKSRISNQIE